MNSIVRLNIKGRSVVADEDIAIGSTIIAYESPIAMVPSIEAMDKAMKPSKITLAGISINEHRLRDHELTIVSGASKAMGRPYRGYSAILAARVLEVIEKEKENKNDDDDDNNNISKCKSVSALCFKPIAYENLKQKEELEITASVTKSLLQIIGIDKPIKTCQEMLMKLSCNAFTIVNDYDENIGIGLYGHKITSINHSCDPNAVQIYGKSSDTFNDQYVMMTVKAIKPIRKHEEITISYIDVSYSTWIRRQELLQGYGFYCNCKLCSLENLESNQLFSDYNSNYHQKSIQSKSSSSIHSIYDEKYDENNLIDTDDILCSYCRKGTLNIRQYIETILYYRHINPSFDSFHSSSSLSSSSSLPTTTTIPMNMNRFLHELSLPLCIEQLLNLFNMSQQLSSPTACYSIYDHIKCSYCHRPCIIKDIMENLRILCELWNRITNGVDNKVTLFSLYDRIYDILRTKLIVTSIYPIFKLLVSYCDEFTLLIHSNDGSIVHFSLEQYEAHIYRSLLSIEYSKRIYPIYHKSIGLRILRFARMIILLLENNKFSYYWLKSKEWYAKVIQWLQYGMENLSMVYNTTHFLLQEMQFYRSSLIS